MRSRGLGRWEASLAVRRACMLRPQRVDNAVYIVTNRETVKSIISDTDLYRGLRNEVPRGPTQAPKPWVGIERGAASLGLRARDSLRLTFRFRGLGRVRPGDASEYRAVGEAGPPRVVEVENPADQFAGRVQARNRLAIGRHHLRAGIDAQPAEGEGDPAGDGVGLERRRVEGVRPVRLLHREPRRAAAVLDVGVERNVRSHGRVVGLDLF